MLTLKKFSRRLAARRGYRPGFGKLEALEIRTVPAAPTYLQVVQATHQAILESGSILREAHQEVLETKADLMKLIQDGYQQNAKDLADAAAAGDIDGVKREISQNKVLANLAVEINKDCAGLLKAFSKIHKDWVNEVSRILALAARRKISYQTALSRLGVAESFFETRYQNTGSAAESAAMSAESELLSLLSLYDNSNGSSSSISFNGDVIGSIEASGLGVDGSIAGTMTVAPFQPVNGATVIVTLNLNDIEVFGNPDVQINSAVGTIIAKYNDNGTLEPISGSVIVSGSYSGVPFLLPATGSSSQPFSIMTAGNQLQSISGDFTIPAIPGLVNTPSTVSFSISPAP